MSHSPASHISCCEYFHQETSNEEENNEESNGSEDEESEGENSTLPLTTADYGEITPGTESIGLAGIQLPKKVIIPPSIHSGLVLLLKSKATPTLCTVFGIIFINLLTK